MSSHGQFLFNLLQRFQIAKVQKIRDAIGKSGTKKLGDTFIAKKLV
jgi:hypothetical protein